MKWPFPKLYDSSVHPEHPNNEPEIEKSDRVAKSATPKYTLDWYVKWFASILLILAVSFRASGIPSLHIWDMILSLCGVILWGWVGFIWRDRSIMLLNGGVTIILFIGLLQYAHEESSEEPVPVVEELIVD